MYNAGARINSSLTASQRLAGVLAVSPSISAKGVIYDRDRLANDFPGWIHGSAGLALSTDLYGTFGSNFMDYSVLRHGITPSVSISWSPDRFATSTQGMMDVNKADSVFYSFSDLSLPTSGTVVSMSLVNTLEGKRSARGLIERNTLADFSLTTSWSPEREGNHFSNISGSLNLTPVNWFSSRGNVSWDPYLEEVENVSVTTSLQLAGTDPTLRPDSGFVISPLSWRIAVAHNWSPDIQETGTEINKLRVSATIDLTSRWSLNYRTYYDIAAEDFISQDYTIRRDLDSWEAIFTRHVSDIDTGFYFRINIKAFPDIKLEQHTSSF